MVGRELARGNAVDDLKRRLDELDASPTIQAVLTLAVFYVRYLIVELLARRKKRKKRQRPKEATDSGNRD